MAHGGKRAGAGRKAGAVTQRTREVAEMMIENGDNTPQETPSRLMPPWQPGQSGNPSGRPKGARNKLSESFLEALLKDFEKVSEEDETVGAKAIAAMRATRPNEYARMIASILAKEFEGSLAVSDEMKRWLGIG